MSSFRLKVWHVEQTCIFELSWGKGQQLTVKLPLPEIVKTRYRHWQQAYIDFYNSQEFYHSVMRARVEISGSMATPAVDWRARLVQAEAELTTEFHHWLSSAELLKIRRQIAAAGRQLVDNEANRTRDTQVDVFLTCDSLELERLPWETWEIGTEFAATKTIRIVRTPANISAETVQRKRQGKLRILAILGDDTGLDFQAEKEALQSLEHLVEVSFQGWQSGKDVTHLIETIRAAIADHQGWDILFFAGHSNETNLTGGDLAIAPNQSILVNEIAPQLLIAKERGLKFAIFNSCQGLTIANTLIDLGLGQVAVMREPIHNQVAQEFLVRFLREMATYQDVQDALRLTCQSFKLDKNLTYPSAYLIPSLFRHPDSIPFRLKPFGWREKLKQWLPTKREAIALSVLAALSVMLPVQGWLMERRVLMQAIHRQFIGHAPTASHPPVLLVQIDEDSILKDKITPIRPISRPYLAQLIDRLSQLNARVIGIDYLLHRYQEGNDQLGRSLQTAATNRNIWFVFATTLNQDGTWQKTSPQIANSNWSVEGDMDLLGDPVIYTRLADDTQPIQDQPQHLPFSYLLALAHQLRNSSVGQLPPSQHQTPLQAEFFHGHLDLGKADNLDYKSGFSKRSQANPITIFSYNLGQMWLHPIIDYSIPPEQVYESISAHQLRSSPRDQATLQKIPQQVVMIAPGGHLDAGVLEGGDNFLIPLAVQYWHTQKNPPDSRQKWTGGEIHAYTIHNLLNRRLIVPIPDLWLIGLAAVLGKGATLFLKPRLRGRRGWLFVGSATIAYGLVSLHVYLAAGVLLPWLLPSATVWVYALPFLLRKHHHD